MKDSTKIKLGSSICWTLSALLILVATSTWAHEPLCPAHKCVGNEIIVDRSKLTNERSYTAATCAYQYQPAHKTKTGKYVDCLTPHHAVEYDWATNMKAYEAVGQALRYARLTGLRGGIVLIFNNDDSEKHYQAVLNDIRSHNLPIDVWIIR